MVRRRWNPKRRHIQSRLIWASPASPGGPKMVTRPLIPYWDRAMMAGVRLFSRNTLAAYVKSRRGRKDHDALKSAVDAWVAEAEAARWTKMADVKAAYATASVINAERVVFNIKGNDYRLVVAFNFPFGGAFVKWIGTHKDYDKIDVETVEYEP